MMNCKICQTPSNVFGKTEILKKFKVSFYFCPSCGFMQTEDPYWLKLAYSSTITKSDIGLLNRNLQTAEISCSLLTLCFDPRQKYIDYGGGYGIFVRLMRDKGFDFYRYDPLCENLFASGFDASEGQKFMLLTAWEVFEHLLSPLEQIEKMLTYSRNIFFSTQLLPAWPRPLGDWWYYGLEHGQHISFYSRKSLEIIANNFGLHLSYSDGTFHLMTQEKFHTWFPRFALHPRLALIRKLFAKRAPQSLLQQDFNKITGITLK